MEYIRGPDNGALNVLIRLKLINSDVTERNITMEIVLGSYCVENLDGDAFPPTH